MAYASKYYDPVKAHEYYMKHRKLKGTTRRGSVASLNEEGKAAAAEVKERLHEELKAALAKLPKRGATEEKKRLRKEYAEKYYAELDKMKADPAFSKIAKNSTQKSSGGAKGSSSKQGSSKERANTSKAEANDKQTQAKPKQKTRTELATEAMSKVEDLLAANEGLSKDEQRQMQPRIDSLISKIASRLEKGLNKLGDGAVKEKPMSAEATARAMKAIESLSSQFASLSEGARAKLQPQIQRVVDRISARLGISSTDIREKVEKKVEEINNAVEGKPRESRKKNKAKVTYSRVS